MVKALSGWREFWEISTSVFFNEELSTKPLPYEMRPRIKIRSFERIVITSSSASSKIQLVSKDKRALRSGYYVDSKESAKGFEKCSVKFIRINTETGKALVSFDKPNGIHQMGHEFSQIIDLTVKEPRNVYAKAFYEGHSLEVWGRIVRSKKSNKFVRWELSVNFPTDDTPLFDKS